jgi:hypothetical protein
LTITKLDLENWFKYHAPKGDQVERYQTIRAAGRVLAEVILANTPPSDEQRAAVYKIRQSVMLANAAIACNE